MRLKLDTKNARKAQRYNLLARIPPSCEVFHAWRRLQHGGSPPTAFEAFYAKAREKQAHRTWSPAAGTNSCAAGQADAPGIRVGQRDLQTRRLQHRQARGGGAAATLLNRAVQIGNLQGFFSALRGQPAPVFEFAVDQQVQRLFQWVIEGEDVPLFDGQKVF